MRSIDTMHSGSTLDFESFFEFTNIDRKSNFVVIENFKRSNIIGLYNKVVVCDIFRVRILVSKKI